MGQGGSKAARKREKILAKRRPIRVITASIIGKRRTQEDRHVALEELDSHLDLAFFAIFDGHNGDHCADFAKNTMHEYIFSKVKKGQVNAALLKQAFIDTDDKFLSSGDKLVQEAGCTAVVAILNRMTGHLITANAGDARCVVNHRGKAQVLTIDHKPDVPEERKRIEAAGRKVVDNRLDGCLAVSRALGDYSLKRDETSKSLDPEHMALSPVPYISEAVLGKDHDFIVLACDGLFDVMSNQEVVDWVSARLKMEKDDENDKAAASAAAAATLASIPPSQRPNAPSQSQSDTKAEEPTSRPPSYSTDSTAAHAMTEAELGTSTSGPNDREDAPVQHRPTTRRAMVESESDDENAAFEDPAKPSDHQSKFQEEKARMERKHKKRREQQKLRMRMQTLSTRPNKYMDMEADNPEPAKEPSTVRTNNLAQDLAEYAVKRGSMDNISIIIVVLGPPRSASRTNLHTQPGDSAPASPRSRVEQPS